MKPFNTLPPSLQVEAVKPYYEKLRKRQISMLLKRILDIVVSLILTVLLLPVLVFFAIWIKIDSPGPVFYRQERVTTYGRTFRIFKFRTMVVDADKTGSLVTLKKDNRITNVGRLIRKYRLDELPQLFNILKGEMTLVGTRPEVLKYVEAYTEEMRATLLMPAGVTSRASMLFKDEDEIIEKFALEGMAIDDIYIEKVLPEKMLYNLAYIDEFSVWTDIKILVETALRVLS